MQTTQQQNVFHLPDNREKWVSRTGTFPFLLDTKPSWFWGLFLMLFGSGFVVMAYVASQDDPPKWDGSWENMLLPIVGVGMFCLFGFGLMLLGLSVATLHRETKITADMVSVTERGLFAKSWKQPLSQYLGVIKHVVGGDDNDYRVLLKHKEEMDYDIRLFDNETTKGWDEAWKQWGQALSKPILESVDGGYLQYHFHCSAPGHWELERVEEIPDPFASSVEQDTRSVPGQTQGRIDDQVNGLEGLPGIYKLEEADGSTQLIYQRRYRSWEGVWFIFFGLLFGGIPMWFWWTEGREPFLLIFGAIGLFLMGAGGMWSFNCLNSKEVLHLYPDRLEYSVEAFGRTYPKATLRVDDLRAIVVKAPNGKEGFAQVVCLSKDDRSIVYTTVLNSKEKQQLKTWLQRYYQPSIGE